MTSTVDEAMRPPAGAHTSPAPAPSPAEPANLMASALRSNWPILALGALSLLISFLARRYIYPAYSYNRDEPVFLWMADHLRSGHLTVPDGGAPQFFHPWLSAPRDGFFFSHFTIGWPAMLLGSEILFGSPGAAPAFGALLAVMGTYALARQISADRRLALVAAALMTASPILPVQGGVYLGYLFSTGLGLLFLAALLSGFRLGRPRRTVLAGALLGAVFLTRPFDAVLWALAGVAYLALVHRRERRQLLGASAWLALGTIPFVLIALFYDQRVTGSAFALPNSAADPLDTFGFGTRRMMPDFNPAPYGLRIAVKSTLTNGFRLPLFLAGGYLGLVVAWVGLWFRRRDRSTLLLLAIIALFPATYFFHWGMWVSSLVATWGGPIYFVPLYAPLCILMATAILAAWRRRRELGIALVAVLVLATVPTGLSRLQADRRISVGQRPWKESTASLKGPALVFVARSSAYLMFFNPFAANNATLDGSILYATDRGAENLDLIARMPRRTAYLQRASLPNGRLTIPIDNPARFPPPQLQPEEHPPKPVVTLTRIRVVEGRALTVSVLVRNPAGKRAVGAYLDVGDGQGPRWQLLTGSGTSGQEYRAAWTVAPSAGVGPRGRGTPVPLPRRLGTLTVAVAYGSDATALPRPAVRQLLQYRMDGSSLQLLLPGDQQVAGEKASVWYQDEKAVAGDRKDPPQMSVSVARSVPTPAGNR